MKTILENYGATIMSMIVILALVSILMFIPDGRGNTGIFEIMGVGSHLDTGLYEHMTDTNAVVAENSAVMVPQISYVPEDSTVKAGQEVVLGDQFKVLIANTTTYKLSDSINGSGDKFYFEILNIADTEGNNCTGIYDATTGKITFPQPGIYSLEISCDDLVNGKNSIVKLYIPIDNL